VVTEVARDHRLRKRIDRYDPRNHLRAAVWHHGSNGT
jgi:hypothetical protein